MLYNEKQQPCGYILYYLTHACTGTLSLMHPQKWGGGWEGGLITECETEISTPYFLAVCNWQCSEFIWLSLLCDWQWSYLTFAVWLTMIWTYLTKRAVWLTLVTVVLPDLLAVSRRKMPTSCDWSASCETCCCAAPVLRRRNMTSRGNSLCSVHWASKRMTSAGNHWVFSCRWMILKGNCLCLFALSITKNGLSLVTILTNPVNSWPQEVALCVP